MEEERWSELFASVSILATPVWSTPRTFFGESPAPSLVVSFCRTFARQPHFFGAHIFLKDNIDEYFLVFHELLLRYGQS